MLNPTLFYMLRPQLTVPEHGTEPDLYTLLMKYYVAGDIPVEKARVLARNYIVEWVKLANQ